MPKISIFKQIRYTKYPENIELITVLEQIRDGRWEDLVTKCRLISDKKERNEFKDTMPRICFSGQFETRTDNGLEQHSGFISLDLDEISNLEELVEKLKKDKYVYSVFMSTSGSGLRVLIKIEKEKHREAFQGLLKYMHEIYQITPDLNGISVSKPFCVTYDPNLVINENSLIFKKYVKETPVKELPNFVHTPEDFQSVLNQIVNRNVSIAEEYLDWIKVGMAIADQFGENGREYFHQISRPSTRYSSKDTDTHYKYFLRRQSSNKANIATFYYFAKLNGISITSERTKTIIRTTKSSKKACLTKEQIIANLEKFANITGADSVVSEVFDKDIGNDDMDDESSLFTLELFISNNYNLKMNEVTGYLEQNGKRLSPSDLNSMFIAAKKIVPRLDYQLMMRLLKSDFIETYNPFFEFFGSDGIPFDLPPIPTEEEKKFESPLIDKLAETIKNDNPAYTLFFVRKWIVSIISSAHKVHSPLLLCLLGGQNTGKTEWFRRLLPKELAEYYAESKLDKEKDDEILMTENLIIMDDELGGKSKKDDLKLKNITSKQWFSLRRPYGDHNEKILRLAVLCGTSNYKEILSDPTGNRRIIPIEVHDIDKPLYNSINKKELFMEAFRLYKGGFDWRITQKDVQYLNKDGDNYNLIVPERELIQKYFENVDELRLTTTEIKVELELLTKQKLSLPTIGREMLNLGFVRKTTRENAVVTVKKWGVKRINRGGESLVHPTDKPNTEYNF